MRPNVLPSAVFEKRLAILKTLLGPGWLAHPSAIGSAGRSRDADEGSWQTVERRYGSLVRWLEPGLDHLCRLRGRTVAAPSLPATAPLPADSAPGGPATAPSADRTLLDPALPSQDAPVALLHAMRTRILVSPAGIDTYCSVVAGDLLEGIVPFLAWLYCLYDQRLAVTGPSARCLVLLSAVPGAGKSVICSMIEQFSRLLRGYPAIRAIAMDGWHLPNKVIQARTVRDEIGRIVALADRKGSPDSFDIKALARDLHTLLTSRSPVRLPTYDRGRHEPVPDAILVDEPIVLLEGNYLLLQGQGWEEVGDMASGAAWLDVPISLACRSIQRRHVAAGRSAREAQAKWLANDGPNAMIALHGRDSADAVLYLDDSRRIRFVHRQ